jgi:hypothetical protein
MAESSVRGQHFEHLVKYALAVCRECQHGVLPSYIKSHVQRAYLAKQKQAKAIAEEVGNWAGLIQRTALDILSCRKLDGGAAKDFDEARG